MAGHSDEPSDTRSGWFTTTHWTVVLTAKESATPGAQAALENLCAVYWRPLYAFVRRRGYDVADAQDLTQEFFARLLEKDFLGAVDRSKGKFRSFLLAALEHFLAKEWRRAHALKRGRGVTFIRLDDDSAEQYFREGLSVDVSPERLFEQQWATTLLEQAVNRLRDEFSAAGKAVQFEELKVFLTGEKQTSRYSDLASKLGATEAGLKMSVSRMRQRYGEVLREEIARTVSGPNEIKEELRFLFAALSQ